MGLFFTHKKGCGDKKLLAAAIDTPVSVMETAGEGGPWGMALLASYLTWKGEDETLQNYLEAKYLPEMQVQVKNRMQRISKVLRSLLRITKVQ